MTMEFDTPTPFAYLRIGKCYEKLGKTRHWNTTQDRE